MNTINNFLNNLFDKLSHLTEWNTSSSYASYQQKHFERDTFSEYIKPAVYDEEHSIYITNDNHYGIIYELSAPARAGQNTIKAVEDLLTLVEKNSNMTIQLILFASKDIDNELNIWENEHLVRNNEMIKEIFAYDKENIKKKLNKPLTQSFDCTLRKNKLFITIQSPEIEEIIELSDKVKEHKGTILNDFYPRFLKPNELIRLLFEMLNPNHDVSKSYMYDDSKYINQQIIALDNEIHTDKNFFEIDGKFYTLLVPQNKTKEAHFTWTGLKLGDYLTQNSNKFQFKDTYFITVNLRPTNEDAPQIKFIKENTRRMNSQGAKSKKALKEKDEIIEKIENRVSLFDIDINIFVSGNTKDDCLHNAEVIKNHWESKNTYDRCAFKMVIPKYITLPKFNFCLPFGANETYFKGKFHTGTKQFKNEVVHLLPLEIDFLGNGFDLQLVSRRANIAFIDIFKNQTNKNAFIVAASGAGKSMLLNYKAFLAYARGSMTFIIDIGRSYEALCSMLGGQFIEIDVNNPISFNPFSNIDLTEELEQDEFQFFIDFIYMLGCNKNHIKSQEEEKLIKGKIVDLFDELLNKHGNSLEITNFKNAFQSLEDQRFIDFGQHLSLYSRGGPYEKFFNGHCTIEYNSEFIVTEIDSVENNPEIRDAVIFLSTYHIGRKIYSQHKTRDQRAYLIIDEAHKFLGKNPQMDDLIENAYRRFRKHNGSIILATQSFADLYNDDGTASKASNAILANSAFKFFLQQEKPSINALLSSKSFSTLSKLDEIQMRSVKSKKGEYSEMFFMYDDLHLVYRYIPNRLFYWIATSDPNDKAMISNVMTNHNLNNKWEAIKHIVQMEDNK